MTLDREFILSDPIRVRIVRVGIAVARSERDLRGETSGAVRGARKRILTGRGRRGVRSALAIYAESDRRQSGQAAELVCCTVRPVGLVDMIIRARNAAWIRRYR